MIMARKVILPAAGLGTRFLPATKAMPKEMLPLVDKPLIQYAVEEACASGLSDIIVVTGRGKAAIEDHFDVNEELDRHLRDSNHPDVAESVSRIAEMARIAFVRQHRPLGLGHAVLQAQYLVAGEPTAVILSDDIIVAEEPCLAQLLRIFNEVHETVVALMEVPEEAVGSYGIVCPEQESMISGLRTVRIGNLIEKPPVGSVQSNLAIIGRYVLHPEVLKVLSTTPTGRNGEIQLTDALQTVAKRRPVYGVLFNGRRFDAGSKLGFIEAAIAMALQRSDLRHGLMEFLTRLVTASGPSGNRIAEGNQPDVIVAARSRTSGLNS